MRKDTSNRPVATWRILFLSSGEISLSTKIEEDGRSKATAGQEVRVLDIPAGASEMGLFEDLHGAANGQVFADEIKSAAVHCYGTPIRAFLAKLTADIDKATEQIQKTKAEFMEAHYQLGAHGQVGRAATRFAVVAAAGELAIRYGILPWEPGDVMHAVVLCFAAWLENRRAKLGASETAAGIAQIRKFLEAHGESRFAPWQPSEYPTANRAGFKKTLDDGRMEFYVLPETFASELCAGFDAKALAAAMVDEGLLHPDPTSKKTAKSMRITALGQARVYHIDAKILAQVATQQ